MRFWDTSDDRLFLAGFRFVIASFLSLLLGEVMSELLVIHLFRKLVLLHVFALGVLVQQPPPPAALLGHDAVGDGGLVRGPTPHLRPHHPLLLLQEEEEG